MNYVGISGRPNGVRRAELAPAQKEQAERNGLVSKEHRAKRPVRVTHAIDNLDPSIPSDRDDGIHVEPKEGGGWTVRVTIADAAAHIPAGSELAKAAYQRGQTLYQIARGVHDPMFGPVMEGRMSLEHGKERLGLDVVMELDESFQPIHTSFERIIAKPDNAVYAQAAERMENDVPFQHMRLVGDAIRKRVFGSAESEELEAQISGDVYKSLTPSEREVFKTVETFMILANREVGRFAHNAALPFIYRNYDGEVKYKDRERAYYETDWTRHKDLIKRNIDYYCHFTSPIRRGPDFFNGHQIHYAIDVVEALQAFMPEKEESELWDMLPFILPDLVRYKQKEIKLHELSSRLTERTGVDSTEFTRTLSRIELPYSKEQLSLFAKNINDLVFHVAMTRKQSRHQLDKQRFAEPALEQAISSANESNNGSHNPLREVDRDKLSSLIDKAVESGRLPSVLAAEVIYRLKHVQQESRRNAMNLSHDAFNILIKAQYPYDTRWRVLKKAMAKTIKHDAMIVNTVYEMIEKEEANAGLNGSGKEPLSFIKASLPLDEYRDGMPGDSFLHAALAIESGQPDVAAPYYSIGHDTRAAESHAKWSYIEHKAFGQLVTFDASRLPNLLYAELDQEGKTKEEVVRDMLQPLGADISIEAYHQVNGQCKASLVVSGGKFAEPLTIEAETDAELMDVDEELAIDLVLKRLLRHPEFKQRVGSRAPLALHREAHPRKELEDKIEQLSKNNPLWRIELGSRENRKQGPDMHHAWVTVTPPSGRSETFEATGNNRDKATNAACARALDEFGWNQALSTGARIGSWARDVREETQNGNRGASAGK